MHPYLQPRFHAHTPVARAPAGELAVFTARRLITDSTVVCVGGGGGAGQQGAPHLHVLVCICSNGRQFEIY